MYLASGTSKYRSLENQSDDSLRWLFGRDSFLPKVFFLPAQPAREGMDEEVRICEDEEISGARDELFSHNVIDRVPELFTSYVGTRSSPNSLPDPPASHDTFVGIGRWSLLQVVIENRFQMSLCAFRIQVHRHRTVQRQLKFGSRTPCFCNQQISVTGKLVRYQLAERFGRDSFLAEVFF